MLLPGIYVICQGLVIRVSKTVEHSIISTFQSPVFFNTNLSHIFNHQLTFYRGHKHHIEECDIDLSKDLTVPKFMNFIIASIKCLKYVNPNFTKQDFIEYYNARISSPSIYICVNTDFDFYLPIFSAKNYKEAVYSAMSCITDAYLYQCAIDHLDYLFLNNFIDQTYTTFKRGRSCISFKGSLNVE